MKTYTVELRGEGQLFCREFTNPDVRAALDCAMVAAEAGLKLTPHVRVLGDKMELVWDSFDAHLQAECFDNN